LKARRSEKEMLIQKLSGITLILISLFIVFSAVFTKKYVVEDTDITGFLVLFLLGLYILVTKEKCFFNTYVKKIN